jgi:DNA-binding beta-propeller fold protein YncE
MLPCHLAVDKNNECIFVADQYNDRIVMLSRSLKCAREFNASLDGSRLRVPWRLYLNQSNSRLYVSEELMAVVSLCLTFVVVNVAFDEFKTSFHVNKLSVTVTRERVSNVL